MVGKGQRGMVLSPLGHCTNPLEANLSERLLMAARPPPHDKALRCQIAPHMCTGLRRLWEGTEGGGFAVSVSNTAIRFLSSSTHNPPNSTCQGAKKPKEGSGGGSRGVAASTLT